MYKHRIEMLASALAFSLAFVWAVKCDAGQGVGATAGDRARSEQLSAALKQGAGSRPQAPRGRILGGGYPGRRVGLLVERAAVIVLGTVESLEALGDGVLTTVRSPDGYVAPARFDTTISGELQPDQYAVTACRAQFHIASVVKGSTVHADSTIAVDFYLPYLGPMWATLTVGEHGLLLLDGNGNLAELFYPLLPVASGASSVSSDLPPLDAVGQYFLLSLRPDTSPSTLESCLDGALDLGIAAREIESLRTLAASQDLAARGIGLRGLVELKDPESIPAAVSYLLSGTSVPGMPQVPIRVGVAIGKLDEPAFALDVVPLLSSSSSVQRGWALQALRKMRNPAAIPALVEALADPDQSIRYGAMMGIAETVGAPSEWRPSVPLFEQDPQHYLGWWAQWWEREGKATYGETPGS